MKTDHLTCDLAVIGGGLAGVCCVVTVRFDSPVTTDTLEIHLAAPSPNVPAAMFEARCYAVA